MKHASIAETTLTKQCERIRQSIAALVYERDMIERVIGGHQDSIRAMKMEIDRLRAGRELSSQRNKP